MSPSGMKVNLLKNRRVLSEKDYLRERQFLQWTIIGLVITVILTTAMALWNFVLSRKLVGIEGVISKANLEIKDLAEANAEQVYIKNRLSLIGNFLDEQANTRESLQEVLAISVPGLTIGNMSFETEDEISVTITADTQPLLKEAIAFYRKPDGFFAEVISDGITRNKDGKYDLNLKLKLPKADIKS